MRKLFPMIFKTSSDIFLNILTPFQTLKCIMKFQPSRFRMISRVQEALSAAIFKTPITATRGLGELVSRQIRIPHTQIKLEHILTHNCTILQSAPHIMELKLTLAVLLWYLLHVNLDSFRNLLGKLCLNLEICWIFLVKV